MSNSYLEASIPHEPSIFPLEIAQFAKGRKVGELIVKIKNKDGIFQEVTNLLHSEGFKVFRIYGGAIDSSAESATFLLFFEGEKSNLTLDQLHEKVRQVSGVQTLFVRGWAQFLVDIHAVPLLESGSPAFIFRRDALVEIEESMMRNLGSSSQSLLLWAGWALGRRDVSWLREILGEQPADKFLQAILQVKQSAGWGMFQIAGLDLTRSKGRIVVDNSVEILTRRKSVEPSCHLLRGYLAGLLSEVFHKPIDAAETRCKSQGNDLCEFTFG